jgi:hypothetical protein
MPGSNGASEAASGLGDSGVDLFALYRFSVPGAGFDFSSFLGTLLLFFGFLGGSWVAYVRAAIGARQRDVEVRREREEREIRASELLLCRNSELMSG